MKALFVLVTAVVLSLSLNGTPQAPDKIIYKGKEYSLETNPLEIYFKEHPQQRPGFPRGFPPSLLLRGYVGIFTINDNKLYVKDIEYLDVVKDSKNKDSIVVKSNMGKVFPNQSLVSCDWFSGYLILSYGKQIKKVHMSYASLYEKYYVIKVVKGKVVEEIKMSGKEYEKFKDSQFEMYKKTEEYKSAFQQMEKIGKKVDEIENWLKLFTPDYASKLFIHEIPRIINND